MGSLLLLLISFLFLPYVYAAPFSEFVYPNFTASTLQYNALHGAFLFSSNSTFKAAIFNPGGQQSNFYLCVIHVASDTIIWSGNPDEPISVSGKVSLSNGGLRISDHTGALLWSTPQLQSAVYAMQLTEMGNLLLMNRSNGSLWESFHNPTDTIVIGQQLPAGTKLSNSKSDVDLSTGDYQFTVGSSDAILQWQGQTYMRLSMDTRAFENSNYPVDYMELNSTGAFLYGKSGSVVVIQVSLSPSSDFRIAKLVPSGLFEISKFSGSKWQQEFVGPADACQVPSICGQMGLCSDGSSSNYPTCSCPSGFRTASNGTGCVPHDGSYFKPDACVPRNNGSQLNSSHMSYLRLDSGTNYFSLSFSEPKRYGVNFSVCQNLCSRGCSCLGVFYKNSSGSCFVIENNLGSVKASKTVQKDLLGYIKVIVDSISTGDHENRGKRLPASAVVLLPLTGLALLAALSFILWRRWILDKKRRSKLDQQSSVSSADFDSFHIPGLPQRFDYEEIEAATNNFRMQIGAGGFGAVYRGIFPDKTVVAVKKITNVGVQGKKEFCTEIAIIGNIHHVNLVRLRGFCAHGRQRFLVYEYMNRGSLDRTLFGSGPVLEWQERFNIAIGAARGLAYLHSGCEQRIIHCDVKPENILLHNNFHAKISDFGLSKLLGPEQSSLFTTMRGTRGYLAPEWLTNAAISDKTDVYSYGMVLLELVSGRKNCSMRSQSHSMDETNSGAANSSSSSASVLVYFPLFALEMHEQGRYLDLADPRLQGRVTSEEVEKLVRIALCCVHEEPALRPNMVTVVAMLEGGIALGCPRMESLNFLRFYGRRFTEASTIGGEQDGSMFMPYQQVLQPNASHSSTTSGSNNGNLSYISSQQISGPR